MYKTKTKIYLSIGIFLKNLEDLQNQTPLNLWTTLLENLRLVAKEKQFFIRKSSTK
jgi:hypothetical protein